MGLTPEQARKLYSQAGAPLPPDMHEMKPASKMRNRKKAVDGILFDSCLEANVFQLLKLWEKAGVIRHLTLQPRFVLQEAVPALKLRAIEYVADFQFEKYVIVDHSPQWFSAKEWFGWQTVVLDAKGYRTDVYRMKVKMFRARHPSIDFQEWTKETLKANGG